MKNPTGRIQLLQDYHIGYYETDEGLNVCLDDFVEQVIKPKDISTYLRKFKMKTKRDDDGKWYEKAETIMSEKFKSKKCKEFQEKWNHQHPTTDDVKEAVVPPVEEVKADDSIQSFHEETDTLTSFLDIRNNYFQYKGKQVFVLIKDGIVWFKGIDVARLLDYDLSNIHRIYAKITKENKMFFDTVNNDGVENQINQHKAIFINLAGMFTMVMKSTKSEAEQFQSWVCNEVLPSINRFGSYSIEKKYGCFYEDHDLYEYDGCNVCYMAFIGVHDGLPLFKYGITFDYYRREYQEHRKTFDIFQLIYLRQTDNNHVIEGLFTKECKSKDLYVQKEFKGKNRTELFTVNESHSLERMKMIMDRLIEQHPTKEHKKYEAEIQQLKQELIHTQEIVVQLKSHNESLQNDKTMLSRLIESIQKEKNTIYQIFENLKQRLVSM